MSAAPLWSLQAVTLTGRSRSRLNAVTCEIPRGVTAILGASGAGKTSLLNLLVQFESPQSGRIVHPQELNSSLPVFWGPPDHGLWPHLTVAQHLAAVAPPGTTDVADLLVRCDLEAVSGSYPATLSLGERSRLCVARAVASDGSILVLDEPLAHINSGFQDRGWGVLRDFVADKRRSLVFATHQPEMALREADWCVLLSSGQLLAADTPGALYDHPATREIAGLMGAGTWLNQHELSTWFADASPMRSGMTTAGFCVRPERLAVSPRESAPYVVESADFLGVREEFRLRHEPSGTSQRFAHRPPRAVLQSGMRVVLTWMALLFVSLLIPGCTPADGPQLTVENIDYRTLPPDELRIPAPRAVSATADGTVYVLDNAGRVLAFDPLGKPLRQWWMPEFSVGKPERILQLRDGRLIVADTHYHRMVIFDSAGNVELMFGREGEMAGEFIYPVAVAEDDRQNLYVCEYGGHDRVQVFRPDGTFVSEFGRFGTEPGYFQRPSGIVWRGGLLYIADAFNNRIHVCHEDGRPAILTEDAFSADLHYPYDIAVSPQGEFYVVEYGAGRVTKFSGDGQLQGRFGTTGNSAGEFETPWGLSVDNQGRVLVADTGNRRIVQITFAP